MSIERFEELETWKTARELANWIYRVSHDGEFAGDYGFRDQIQRAAVSVLNNVAEGFERGSNKDFAKFLFIARGSVGEVRSMLYPAKDFKYLTEGQFDEAMMLCVRESKMLWGLIKHLQKNSDWKTGIKILVMILLPAMALRQRV